MAEHTIIAYKYINIMYYTAWPCTRHCSYDIMYVHTPIQTRVHIIIVITIILF